MWRPTCSPPTPCYCYTFFLSFFLSQSLSLSLSSLSLSPLSSPPPSLTALPSSSASLTVQHTHQLDRKWYRLKRGEILQGFGHEGDFRQHVSDFLSRQGPEKLPSAAEIVASAKELLPGDAFTVRGLLWAYDYDAIWPNLASACRCAMLPLPAFTVKTNQPAALLLTTTLTWSGLFLMKVGALKFGMIQNVS